MVGEGGEEAGGGGVQVSKDLGALVASGGGNDPERNAVSVNSEQQE